MTIDFYEKAIATWIIIATIVAVVGISWGFGFAYGKQYWKQRYEWINEDLRTDIQNCRDTLNQCKRDLDNPHRCVSVCVEQFEKFGC